MPKFSRQPTEAEILHQFENSRLSLNQITAAKRLGALSFAAASIQESEQYYVRTTHAVEKLLAEEARKKHPLPSQDGIFAQAFYDLDAIVHEITVYGEISNSQRLERAYDTFIDHLGVAADRARPLLSGPYPNNPNRRLQYHTLIGALNSMAILGLLLRDECKGELAGKEISLPAFIEHPLHSEQGLGIELKQWHINRYVKSDGSPPVLKDKLYTRFDRRVIHNTDLPDDISVIWVKNDVYHAAGQKTPNGNTFPLQIIDELRTADSAEIVTQRITALRQAIGQRSIGELRGILPQDAKQSLRLPDPSTTFKRL